MENQRTLNISLTVFLCPSTSNYNPTVPGILEWNDGKLPVKVVGTAARSDYELVGGVHVLPQNPTTSLDLRGVRFGVWGEPTYNTGTGASLRYRKARLADVTDGLTNTLLIGERAGRPDYYRRGEQPDPYPYRDPVAHGQGRWPGRSRRPAHISYGHYTIRSSPLTIRTVQASTLSTPVEQTPRSLTARCAS